MEDSDIWRVWIKQVKFAATALRVAGAKIKARYSLFLATMAPYDALRAMRTILIFSRGGELENFEVSESLSDLYGLESA